MGCLFRNQTINVAKTDFISKCDSSPSFLFLEVRKFSPILLIKGFSFCALLSTVVTFSLTPFSSNTIYVTNIGNIGVSVIDGTSNTIVGTLPVGTDHMNININSTTIRVYLVNSGSNDVNVYEGLQI